MSYYNWDDCTFTFTQDLSAYVKDISGIKLNAVLEDFHPMGVAFPTPIATGLYNADDLTVTFKYDGGGAATPPVCCAAGNSATLTLVTGTNQSVSGTYVVESTELDLGTEGSHTFTANFKASGTITWDVLAAS